MILNLLNACATSAVTCACIKNPDVYQNIKSSDIVIKAYHKHLEETVGREIFRFAQNPPHTRFDTMGGFFDQYEELLGTLSPCDMVHLSPRSRYVCYPSKPEMCSKFAKYTMTL